MMHYTRFGPHIRRNLGSGVQFVCLYDCRNLRVIYALCAGMSMYQSMQRFSFSVEATGLLEYHLNFRTNDLLRRMWRCHRAA